MLKDLLIYLPSYPRPVSRSALRRAVDFARRMEAHATCIVGETTVPPPVAFHPYGVDLETRLAERQREVHQTARSELAAFEEEASRVGLAHEGRIVKGAYGEEDDQLLAAARLHCLTVVPMPEDAEASADLVQTLVFEAGRPVLVLPESGSETFSLDDVVVAWDGTRAAARAVADAMPLLERAAKVRIVTVGRDKPLPEHGSAHDLATHLRRNGIEATPQEEERGSRSVGEALDQAAGKADLMVMGAFGHSRIRDFFLGGATRHVLRKPRRATLLSH